MSRLLISRSPDLQRLRNDGYDVEVRAGHLLLKQVPYVNAKREVCRGVLVSTLDLGADEVTVRPTTHVAHFAGEYPCFKDGKPISQIGNANETKELAKGVTINHSFSSKPACGYYDDYYEKMRTYASLFESQAAAIDPKATARVFPIVETAEGESPLRYEDTASSRAGIGAVTEKLARGKVSIIGLGGTGSYVLDLVSKTPVREIHLFDDDDFLLHNLLRAPGAPTKEELGARPKKVEHWRRTYDRVHRGIVAHPYNIDEANLDLLQGMEFVFLCLDGGGAKRAIVERLRDQKVPFVDVGMGITLENGFLGGILRVTTSTDRMRDHVIAKQRIPFGDGGLDNEYSRNIQIADLNALNAALAVVRWKRHWGFYRDLGEEHFSTYTIDGNLLTNDDRP